MRHRRLNMELTRKTVMENKADIRQRIVSIGFCKSLRHRPADYDYFYALFQRHPEAERKRVAEIVDIYIEQVRGDARLGYILPDGTRDTISWNKCISGKLPPDGVVLTKAMREAIEQQLYHFKKSQPQQCVLCESTLNITVDHYPTKFRDIRDSFLEGKTPPSVFAKRDDSRECFRSEDLLFKEEWMKYHSDRATYRILCYKCNVAVESNGPLPPSPSYPL